jgi:hypothetical protein
VRFLWTEALIAEYIHKEMLPVYGGKCMLCKAFHNWVANVSLMTEVHKWPRQQSKDFSVAGFDTLVKLWDKCINVGGGYVKK